MHGDGTVMASPISSQFVRAHGKSDEGGIGRQNWYGPCYRATIGDGNFSLRLSHNKQPNIGI
jgi:hypothetical protein